MKITCEDNMELMARYPDGYFDLAIVDPPYGYGDKKTNILNFRQKEQHREWNTAPTDSYFLELFRVTKNQIIWGGNYFLNHIGNTRSFLIWDKLNPDRCFADCEFAWNSTDQVARIFKGRPQELNKKDNGKIHPTQKPVPLYKWLLKNYATPGDKILDTHAGSFSIGIACWEMGFDLEAYEIDKDYHAAALKRFKERTSQGRLFVPQKEEFVQTSLLE